LSEIELAILFLTACESSGSSATSTDTLQALEACAPSDFQDVLISSDPKPVLQCLPLALQSAADGSVNCVVIEARTDEDDSCALPGRSPIPPEHAELRDRVQSDPNADPGWTSFCELGQLIGTNAQDCQSGAAPAQEPGYCYISEDPDETVGDPAVIEACIQPRRALRFVGDDVLVDDRLFIYCDAARDSCE
jgi:hypothetical protein